MKHTKRRLRRPVDGKYFAVHGQWLPGLLTPTHRLLVRYSSRDAVELHGRGNGGVVEVRSTIEQYSEKSPLYGFVQYRRRRVVLKYVPEGTSRLLQGQRKIVIYYPQEWIVF